LYLKVAGVVGLFVASPIVLYQVWLFIAPGLYRNEKRYVLPFMVSTVSLFLAADILDTSWSTRRLCDSDRVQQAVHAHITIEEYSSLFLTIIVAWASSSRCRF